MADPKLHEHYILLLARSNGHLIGVSPDGKHAHMVYLNMADGRYESTLTPSTRVTKTPDDDVYIPDKNIDLFQATIAKAIRFAQKRVSDRVIRMNLERSQSHVSWLLLPQRDSVIRRS